MENQSLLSLVKNYFKHRNYDVKQNVMFDGVSGLIYKFDLLLQKDDVESIVLVMDWNRTVGVDVVVKADRASEDVGILNPIIVAKNFSSHAKAYSNRRRITLLTKRKILSELGTLN